MYSLSSMVVEDRAFAQKSMRYLWVKSKANGSLYFLLEYARNILLIFKCIDILGKNYYIHRKYQ